MTPTEIRAYLPTPIVDDPYIQAEIFAYELVRQTKSYPPETLAEARMIAREIGLMAKDMVEPMMADHVNRGPE